MTAILLSKQSQSGMALAEALRIPLNLYREPCIVIRWGHRFNSYIDSEATAVLNKASAIELSSHKAACRVTLEAAGIPVPRNVNVWDEEAVREVQSRTFIVGRKEKHCAGSGFFVCRTPAGIRRALRKGCVYFSEYYPKTAEYRVHVAGGKTLLVSVKEGPTDKLIWSHKRNGFIFRHLHRHVWREDPTLMEMVRVAKRAVEVVGLDFGAVDCMVNPDHEVPFVVCEINTTPSLSPLALEKYVAYFKGVIDNEV